MSDTTCPWVNGTSATQGSKYIAIEHATDNGCTIPATIPTWQSDPHVCYDFEGHKADYPVKACTFDGPHTDRNSDPGSTVNWIYQTTWDFFKQFWSQAAIAGTAHTHRLPHLPTGMGLFENRGPPG